jgi:Holliday junction resolvase RusA-like endonuclease|tara:strand:- start:1831 stop:2160 length:330 start_codon:yes stop_codon:yes gene_type:complete
MTIQIHRKPLSVNACWQGKRFKTPLYKDYEKEILELLPEKYEIPEGDLQVRYEFGLNTMADWDNPVKPLQDILQKKYDFDDRRIMKAEVIKKVVKKGDGYFNFEIRGLE